MSDEFDLEQIMESYRSTLKNLGKGLLSVKDKVMSLPAVDKSASDEDRGEEIANITLAYRHLEDCIMRCGKAIQAKQGGKSIYDKAAGKDQATASASTQA